MPGIRDLIVDLDRSWEGSTGGKTRMPIIGSTALMLQAVYERGTKDSDVLETPQLVGDIATRLVSLAGQNSDLHRRHGLYIEIVANGLPFLPQAPAWHSRPDLNRSLVHFHIEVLDVVDVVVSKLKRFNSNDQADVDAMVERELVPHDRLLSRFRAAVDYYAMDSRAEDLPRYVKNLHRVERDLLGVPETDIDLPSWV